MKLRESTRIVFYMAVLCAGLFLINGCGKSFEDIHIAHVLPPFHKVEIHSVFDVVLVEGDSFKLEITGREDIAGKTEFRVENDILYIDSRYGGQWLSPGTKRTTLIITSNNLARVFARETCHIETHNTITSDHFELTLGGKLNFASMDVDCRLVSYYNTGPTNGEVEIRGRSEHLHIYIGALMLVDARHLICDYAVVGTSSKLDVHVQVNRHLVYSIGNSGNIFLWNEPEVVTADEVTSSGKLIRM